MAKQIGDIKITGTFDNLSFYVCKGVHLVRMKGGPTRKQVLQSPRFARSRENFTEFGKCSSASKLLRQGLKPILPVQDSYMYNRMTQRLHTVMKMDGLSDRGQRTVANGLKTQAGKDLLTGFEFNEHSGLPCYLQSQIDFRSGGELVINDVMPGTGLRFPEGAASCIMSVGRMSIDFDSGTADVINYNELHLNTDSKLERALFKPLRRSEHQGHKIYFLQIQFFKEDKGKDIPFNGGTYDVLTIVGVNPIETTKAFRALRDTKGNGRQFAVSSRQLLTYTNKALRALRDTKKKVGGGQSLFCTANALRTLRNTEKRVSSGRGQCGELETTKGLRALRGTKGNGRQFAVSSGQLLPYTTKALRALRDTKCAVGSSWQLTDSS